MRVLVTGSAGFIGQHLTRALRYAGHDVWGCDLAHGEDEMAWGLRGDVLRPRYLRCDVRDFLSFSRAVVSCDPELVYHTAAEYGRWNGEDHYQRLWETNAIGTKHLIRLQEQIGFKLVHFSSSEVYGDWPAYMAEDTLDFHPIHQLNDYALSKMVNEQQIRNSMRQHGTESVILRLFNLYGPGEHYSPYRSMLCRFIYCALHGLPLNVYTGHQRCCLYIDDAVRAFVAIAEHFTPGAVYNIGSETVVSVEDMAALVVQVTQADPVLIQHDVHEPMTTRIKRADTYRARVELGLEAKVDLTDGIARTAAWMRSYYGKWISVPQQVSA